MLTMKLPLNRARVGSASDYLVPALALMLCASAAYPYNDFTVTNEAVRGDIYLSVPEGFAPGRLGRSAGARPTVPRSSC